MIRFGLDSTSPVPIGAHRAVGSTVALRYLSRFSWKILTAAEVATYRANRVDLVTVFEDSAGNALAGFNQGAADARFALWQAHNLGLPAGRPIYFAVDMNEAPGQAGTIAAYFRGVNSVLGVARTGAYGGYWAIKRLFDARLIHYGWQTYAWSGGNFDKRSQVYQYSNAHVVGGVGVDFNHVYGADFGQWWAPVPSKPKPAHASGQFRFEGEYDHDAGTVTVHGTKGNVKSWGDVSERIRLEVDLEVGAKNPKRGQWSGAVSGTRAA